MVTSRLLRLRGERLRNALLLKTVGIDLNKELSEWLGDIGMFLLETGRAVSHDGKSEKYVQDLRIAADAENAPQCADLINLIMIEAGI